MTETPIGEFVKLGIIDIQTGPFGTQLHSYDYVSEGVPVIPTEGIAGGRVDHTVLPKISHEKAEELYRHRLKKGDILFARRGVQATGKTSRIREAEEDFICGTGAIRLRVAPEQETLNASFLAWFLTSPDIVVWIREQAIGATMPNLNEGIIKRLSVLVPPLPEQREIAAILGALDDKIEVNRKASATLEAMARALYRSWFVDFDPVWAKLENRPPAHMPPQTAALFPDSFDDEGLPLGWRTCGLDEIADFLNGAALQKHPAKEGEEFLPVIKIAELRNGITPNSNKAAVDLPEKYRVFDGDVIFSWSGSLLQKVWTGGPGALNQHLFKVTSNIVPKWFHFFAVDQHMDDFRMTAASKATTMGHIQRHHLADAKIAMPDKAILDAANAQVAPLFDKAFRCDMENQTLATLRDSLLPRLMSGELRVGDARAQVEEVA